MVFKVNVKKRLKTDYIVVHASATNPKTNVGAAEIDRWHRKRGFQAIGYHYVIKRDGTVEQGREEDVVGAHVEGFNSASVGICMVGGVSDQGKSENNFTEEQFKSLEVLLRELRKRYPKATIQGHRDFPNVAKDCPCFRTKEFVKELGIPNP
jgi:N-acetylmuramoyl-L-alanine amidase